MHATGLFHTYICYTVRSNVSSYKVTTLLTVAGKPAIQGSFQLYYEMSLTVNVSITKIVFITIYRSTNVITTKRQNNIISSTIKACTRFWGNNLKFDDKRSE